MTSTNSVVGKYQEYAIFFMNKNKKGINKEISKQINEQIKMIIAHAEKMNI